MSVARANVPIKNIPVPELAVATEIKLTARDAADGHADGFQFRAAIHRAFAARRQRLHPLRAEFFIRRHERVEILPRERPGHDRQPREGQSRRRERGSFQEAATVEREFFRRIG